MAHRIAPATSSATADVTIGELAHGSPQAPTNGLYWPQFKQLRTMLNFALDHLPVFMNVQRPSDACERIILSPLTRRAIVQWHSGSISGHHCRKRDMVRLLMPGTSLGQWANRTLLADHRTVTI
jgi:hypothetical protein